MSEAQANPLSSADLAAFVAAVEAASVHGAADALDLTQSAVTTRLQALERRAAVKLFERGRFGMRPTCCRDGSARFDWPSQPDMRAQVEIVNSPRVLQAVREREVQIGFVEGLDPLDGYDTLRVREDPSSWWLPLTIGGQDDGRFPRET